MSKRRRKKKSKSKPARAPAPRVDLPLTEDEKRAGKLVLAMTILSAAMLAVRLYASRIIGFGDSEALYACYALHPQPAYVDHPGLIGVFARAIGGDHGPIASDVHLVTGVLATIAPWLVALVARRAMDTSRTNSLYAAMVFAVVPEIAIGLYAMTPDLLLAFLELGAIGLTISGMRDDPKSGRAAAMLALGALSAGVAASAKVSGILVLLGICIAIARSRHAKSIWPWVGVVMGLLVLSPAVRYEAMNDWPMLQHRFSGIGLSWKGIGALTGGQLAYVSPILFVIAIVLAVDLWRHRNDDDVARVLASCTFASLVPLVLLCLVHRGAEPHWLAPALLPLPLWAARRGSEIAVLTKRWLVAGGALSFLIVAFVHFWTLYPRAPSLAPASYDPKVDITNELYGWENIDRLLDEVGVQEEGTVVVGPHWVISAQLEARFPSASVGCAGDTCADFAMWNPRAKWSSADRIIFVTDARFPETPEKLFPEHNVAGVQHVTTLRGGRVVRTFTITLLEKRAHA